MRAGLSSDYSWITDDLSHRDRTWDFAIQWYDASRDSKSDIELFGSLSKFPDIWSIGIKWFLQYDAVMFTDDDMKFQFGDIDRLFKEHCFRKMKLSQAALTEHSSTSWNFLYARPWNHVRMTNFVEIQAPLFSKSALRKCFESFHHSVSGYGLDLVWPHLLDNKGIGIFDCITMEHTRPYGGGTFYKMLQSLGIDPQKERLDILERYGVKEMVPVVVE